MEMLVWRRVMMTWGMVGKSLQALVAHALLFSFTLLLVLKIDHVVPYSWWIIFSPLWFFHGVIARGLFSLPAPSMPHDLHCSPYHAVMATPSLVAFELLLCIHLESSYAVNLKIVFLPLLTFEVTILIDNIRLLGWGSIDETRREEQARIYYDVNSKYNTFSPDMVMKRPRAVLAKEICRLQAALAKKTDAKKFSQQEYERLQNEKILCSVCFEEQINVALLPCRHHTICRNLPRSLSSSKTIYQRCKTEARR